MKFSLPLLLAYFCSQLASPFHIDQGLSRTKYGLRGIAPFPSLPSRIRKPDTNLYLLSRVIELLHPGISGQIYGDRALLHAINARRPLTDPQVWTHIFFLSTTILAAINHFFGMLLLLCITTPLSILYHHGYEKPGLLASIEGIFAKLLFLYGFIQIFQAPSSNLIILEGILMMTTLSIFVITNLIKETYDPWHCLMHVVPPLWANIVCLKHKPLLNLL